MSEDSRPEQLPADISSSNALVRRIAAETHADLARMILELSLEFVPAIPEVANVASIAAQRQRWEEAQAAFDAVRRETLRAESRCQGKPDPELMILGVAENTAKVIYNATYPLAPPFDSDSMAYLILTASELSAMLGEDRFSNELRDLVAGCATDEVPGANHVERPAWIELLYQRGYGLSAFKNQHMMFLHRNFVQDAIGGGDKSDLRRAALASLEEADGNRVIQSLFFLMVTGEPGDLDAVKPLLDHTHEGIRKAARTCSLELYRAR